MRYVTGHRAQGKPLELDWASLASEDTTLVVYMGTANMALFSMKLMLHGLPASMPVMALASATTPRERRLVSRLDRIARDATAAGLTAPVLFIIGHVVSLYQAMPACLPAREILADLPESANA